MEGKSWLRYIFIGIGLVLFVKFILPKFTGGGKQEFQPLVYDAKTAPKKRLKDERCTIKGNGFTAELSTRSAALTKFKLAGRKWTVDGKEGSAPFDVITTPDDENRRTMRFGLREKGADSQLPTDLLDWKLESHDEKSCTFSYKDENSELKKVVKATANRYELTTELQVKNLSKKALRHQASVAAVAWWKHADVKGTLGRPSPYTTEVECKTDKGHEIKTRSDFEPKDFKDEGYKNGWFNPAGKVEFAAASNFFFSQALVPQSGAPQCQLVVEERWRNKQYQSASDDPLAGAFYRSRLKWAAKELKPGESATYKVLHYSGPKELGDLAAAGGSVDLTKLIHLGRLGFIATHLKAYFNFLYGLVGSWGVAIILMTISIKILVFPLMWKQLKNGIIMRRIQPQMDKLKKDYKDDPQGLLMAQRELQSEHGVNMFIGCLPMILQMPIWFALYTTLQTSTELFHSPFLWIHDLSAPDTIPITGHNIPFIMPILLGATMFAQQKIMPQQMDAQQQKMMTYLMPSIFTAMMLFMPAGLGVYIFTNTLFSMLQQVAVEKIANRKAPNSPGGGSGKGSTDSKNKGKKGSKSGSSASPLALGKGKASA